MPAVKRQRVTGNGQSAPVAQAGAAPEGSLLARARPATAFAAATDKVLIYGVNRVGKTTLACQWPKPLALVSFESGAEAGDRSVARMRDVDYFHVKTALDALTLCQELPDSRYATVVVDSATSLQEACLAEIMGLPELPAQLDWGVATSDQYRDRSAKAKEVLRRFLGLPQHVIVTAKEKDHNPPKDERGGTRRDKLTRGLSLESFIACDLGQATAGWLMDSCPCVCRLYLAKEVKVQEIQVGSVKTSQEIETGRIVRRLLTQLHPNFAAGIRSAAPDKVPEFIEGGTPEDIYKKLMAVLRA